MRSTISIGFPGKLDRQWPTMSSHANPNSHGGSKSRVNLAGEHIRKGTESLDDLRVIDDWRAAKDAKFGLPHSGTISSFA